MTNTTASDAGSPTVTLEQQRNMLLDALISMVEQFCPNVRNNEYVHEYLRAQEDAFYALVDCGAAEWVHNNDFQIRLLPEIG